MIRSNSCAIPKQELKHLLCWVQKSFPNTDPMSAFPMFFWDFVGVKFYDRTTHCDLTAAKLLLAYHVLIEIFSKQSNSATSLVVLSVPLPPLPAVSPLAAEIFPA